MAASRKTPQARAAARTAESQRPYHHGDLRSSLIEQGMELLEETGPAGLSLRDLARRAGVSHAAPYRHFPSRDDLLAALAEAGFRELTARGRSAALAFPDQPLARFGAYGRAYVEFAGERPMLYRLMFGESVFDWSEQTALGAAGEASFGLLVEYVAECQAAGLVRAGSPAEMAASAWAYVHGIANLWIDGRLDALLDGADSPVKRESKAAKPAARGPRRQDVDRVWEKLGGVLIEGMGAGPRRG